MATTLTDFTVGGDDDDDDDLLGKLATAREFCLVNATDQTLVAMFLLRRKIRTLGPEVDEETVINTIDGPVGLLIPGVSVHELWLKNRASSAQLWGTLTDILRLLDRYRPDEAH